MKFKSRQDGFFRVVIYGTCLMVAAIAAQAIMVKESSYSSLVAASICVMVIAFVLWLFHGTSYVLDQTYLRHKTAFIKGKILIKDIAKLEVGKTMWVGYKPATARNGIIVTYGKYNEIYISPDSNESFVKEILSINPDIKVVYS